MNIKSAKKAVTQPQKQQPQPEYTVAIHAIELPSVGIAYTVGQEMQDGRKITTISLSPNPGQAAYDILGEDRFPLAIVTAGIDPLIVTLAKPVQHSYPEECKATGSKKCKTCSTVICVDHPEYVEIEPAPKKGIKGSVFCEELCDLEDCNECVTPAEDCDKDHTGVDANDLGLKTVSGDGTGEPCEDAE